MAPLEGESQWNARAHNSYDVQCKFEEELQRARDTLCFVIDGVLTSIFQISSSAMGTTAEDCGDEERFKYSKAAVKDANALEQTLKRPRVDLTANTWRRSCCQSTC